MRVALLTYLLVGFFHSAYADATSHCGESEQIIFSCQIRDSSKVLSLCASKDLSDSSGYLQYRFGKLNEIELEYPADRKDSQKQFLYRHYFRYQVDETEISFVNQGHEYTIYSYYEGDGDGTPQQEEGVQVDDADLQCAGFGNADFAPLEGAVPGEQE